MFRSVELPLWLLVLIVAFAAVTALSHLLLPSVRWFFRKRAQRVVARLNERLTRPIEPFKLARRHDMIQRLLYDPEVTAAIVEESRRVQVPENVAFEQARRYAREIVPSFSATAYFAVGMRAARWLSNSTYDVRLGDFDRAALGGISRDATVIFVMNHRSNMDYVLVTWLVSSAGAMSYAVGEWARIWPLSSLIKMMGAYFIRRRSRGQLYRRVLARYVQMATRNGVTQALFPEGGLSLDGRIAPPKMGLISYIAADFDPAKRDVIFVPVALNYDRVLEDRILIAAQGAEMRKFTAPLGRIARATLFHLWRRLTRRFQTFGMASVSFGAPLSLAEFAQRRDGDLARQLSAELMARIAQAVPVLPVPMVALAMLGERGAVTRADLESCVAAQIARLEEDGRSPAVSDPRQVVERGLAILVRRKLIVDEDGALTIPPGAVRLVDYYAGSIAHLLPGPDLAAKAAE